MESLMKGRTDGHDSNRVESAATAAGWALSKNWMLASSAGSKLQRHYSTSHCASTFRICPGVCLSFVACPLWKSRHIRPEASRNSRLLFLGASFPIAKKDAIKRRLELRSGRNGQPSRKQRFFGTSLFDRFEFPLICKAALVGTLSASKLRRLRSRMLLPTILPGLITTV